ncbi:hypothetical protein [Colwellia sp. 12G3]|uniref:hypothetical protein n=1 Tax=Colwellia sp. 12G3 TaxID=2058299 RepID=UPI000C34A4A9|nr:hypothetical protein [Colwellia sp. 12G3]PKI14341.1 hypothetical protein CXF71_17440 [Colwellia sp. 12G3]
MKEDQFNAWELLRTKGKLRFFIVNGVLSYGLPMLILMAFISKPFSEGFTFQAASSHFITWSLAGLLFGVSMWYLNEYMYKKELVRRTNT